MDHGANTHFASSTRKCVVDRSEPRPHRVVRQKAERMPMANGSVLRVSRSSSSASYFQGPCTSCASRLPGGELQARPARCRFLAGSPNFLLLDKPTNDLDMSPRSSSSRTSSRSSRLRPSRLPRPRLPRRPGRFDPGPGWRRQAFGSMSGGMPTIVPSRTTLPRRRQTRRRKPPRARLRLRDPIRSREKKGLSYAERKELDDS